MLTSKAKPPARPDETTPSHTTSRSIRASSRRRSRPRRSRDKRSSRSQSTTRRPLPRHRTRSHQSHGTDQRSPSPRLRHQNLSVHHDRSGHREEDSIRPPKIAFTAGRNMSHPIYHRSNAMRKKASNTEGWWQVHSDPNTTVFTRSPDESYPKDSRHRQDRPSITLTSRSRSKEGKRTQKTHYTSHGHGRGIHLYPRPQFESSSAWRTPAYREHSMSEAESAQVDIPPPATLDQPDWARSSQEREQPGGEEHEEDQMMPIPKTQSLEADWKLSVQRAFADHTRTKAPCEIPEAHTIRLVQMTSKRQYDGGGHEVRALSL